MAKKLIIGCGYLGQRVADAWLDNGDDVFALTRSEGNARKMVERNIKPIIGDVTQPESLKGPLDDTLGPLSSVETVLYAVGFDRSAGPSKREVYVDGLRNVLNCLKSASPRFIYISSTSVYGQSNEEWIDEDSETNPDKEGGQICLAAEELLMREMPTANVLRLSGIYGPARLLSRVESLKAGTLLAGDPNAWLNLIHVNDAANVVLRCESNSAPGKRYLVSDNRPIPRGDYYGKLAEIVHAPAPHFDGSEARHSSGLGKRCRNAKVKTELNVELAFPTIDEGLPHAVGN